MLGSSDWKCGGERDRVILIQSQIMGDYEIELDLPDHNLQRYYKIVQFYPLAVSENPPNCYRFDLPGNYCCLLCSHRARRPVFYQGRAHKPCDIVKTHSQLADPVWKITVTIISAKRFGLLSKSTRLFHSILFHHLRMRKQVEGDLDELRNGLFYDDFGNPRWNCFV